MEGMKIEIENLSSELRLLESKIGKDGESSEKTKMQIDELMAENGAYKSMLQMLKRTCHSIDSSVEVPLTDEK